LRQVATGRAWGVATDLDLDPLATAATWRQSPHYPRPGRRKPLSPPLATSGDRPPLPPVATAMGGLGGTPPHQGGPTPTRRGYATDHRPHLEATNALQDGKEAGRGVGIPRPWPWRPPATNPRRPLAVLPSWTGRRPSRGLGHKVVFVATQGGGGRVAVPVAVPVARALAFPPSRTQGGRLGLPLSKWPAGGLQGPLGVNNGGQRPATTAGEAALFPSWTA